MRNVIVVACLCAAQTAQADEVVGVWKGTWTDDRSGHRGPLRGKIKQAKGGDYKATFTGRFYGVIPFWFRTPLEVAGESDGRTILAGERRLGLFGRFEYTAVVGGGRFESDFQSGRWSGRFSMRRVR